VAGGREVASKGVSECLLTLTADTGAEVDEIVQRAIGNGADVVSEPDQQPWGYTGSFTDPDGHVWMVTAESEPQR
jgi:predicted lactoylglutathione lyase